MPLSAEYSAFIEDLLAPFGAVNVRRMFGGGGVYHEGVMFALIADDTLYLKADAETEGDFAAEGSRPFEYRGKNRPISLSYWQVPERLYEDTDELAEWASRAFAAALRAQKPGRGSRR
ncbi:MAG: TfoX/Sxy family protein [Hyphomicrobiales bacterium]|nr:TfoX/Sxy family protein [Hyphomicrobiales bacterium]